MEPSNDPPRPPAPSAPPPGWADPLPAAQPAAQPAAAEAGVAQRWRRLIWLGAALAGVLAAIVITSLRGGDAGVTPLSPIAAAAERTAAVTGANVAGTGALSVDGRTMTMQFSGQLNGHTNRSTMRMDFVSAAAPAGALAQLSPMLIVGDGTSAYVSAPIFANQLPGGESWMKIDYGALDVEQAQDEGVPNAKEMLDQLQEIGSDVAIVGREQVRGVATTHYTAALEKDGQTSTVGVWVDRRNYVRRVAMTVPFNVVGGPNAQMAMQMDFYDFGIEPRIDLPAEGDVFDATELVHDELESELDS